MRIKNIRAIQEYTGLKFNWVTFTGVESFSNVKPCTRTRIWGIAHSFYFDKKEFR